ncbi:response regulator [Marinifilum sp. N1E240]|uniref:response regulator n=1 Tax=Marinifilum sp. N1E240 TaxID=2608082 RepID=UPI00128DDC76|nr:response regulator [Marinifilum sp. N1E240]MPQ47084.1 response regulator [Marinifilum sp. N1E240]
MDTNRIITDISFLYELSLSVGQSLDKKVNCKKFLHTLMSRKNLEFGGVWLRSYNIPYSEETSGYRAIYSHPIIKLESEYVSDSEFLNSCFDNSDSFSVKLDSKICQAIGFKFKNRGVVTFFKLQELGFLVLYSSSEQTWSQIEQTKLKNVINKFSISIKACLFHEKSIHDLITISKTQNELKKAKLKAEESNELKSAFLSNISHEFRTPINSIVGFSNLLTDSDIPPSQHSEFVSHISSNSNKLLKLINNLLDVSKMDSNQLVIERENFNINQLIREIHSKYLINDSSTNQNDISISIPDNYEELTINSDKKKFLQIFENLIDNALKFTSNGNVEFGFYMDDYKCPVFFIRDTGVGISKDTQDVVFDTFRQVEGDSKRKFEGSGLGLTLCKKLLDLMNGEIWFDSEENVGSNFYFRLSGIGRIKMDYINDNNTEIDYFNKIKSIEYSKKNILIAEDVKSNFNYLNAIIELTDANVIWAKNGKDAIQICQNNDPKIDLVLMDIRMPEIGGLEAINQIKSTNRSIPVIVQTAFAMANEKEECLNAGANDFITKPIDPQTLMQILQQYL